MSKAEPFDEEAFRALLIEKGTSPEVAAEIAAKTAAGRRPSAKTAGSQIGLNLSQAPTPAEEGAPAAPPAAPQKPAVLQRHRDLIEEALQLEEGDAKRVGATGYMARTLAQATLPHGDPKLAPGMLYSRATGRLTLTVAPTSPKYGIPFGTVPRVVLAWICTEAVRTQDPVLSLGRSQAEFLRKLRMGNNGREIARFRDQTLRLFRSVIAVEYDDDKDGDLSRRLSISDKSAVFWHPKKVDQPALWDSTLELSGGFFKEIVEAPVPVNLDVFHALSRSPLAMDIYTWLTYRMFVLRRSGRPDTRIPWEALMAQFGAGYANTDRGLLDFKANFRKRLKEVLLYYPEAVGHVTEEGRGSKHLKLTPCALHIEARRA